MEPTQVCYHVHRSLPLVPILDLIQMNSFHTFPSSFLNVTNSIEQSPFQKLTFAQLVNKFPAFYGT